MRRWLIGPLLGALLGVSGISDAQPFPTQEHVQTGDAARIRVLSSHNDLVTGGDALVEIVGRTGAAVTLNGRPVTDALRPVARSGRRVGLITGLKLGDNVLEVAGGRAPSRLILTNWPLQGPVISGPHETPFICMTDSFELPVTGGTLGPAASADCDAATRVDYVYRRREGGFRPLPAGAMPGDIGEVVDAAGKPHPYIVRVETGVVNRSIYQLAMLHDPRTAAPTPAAPSRSWNRGLIYVFGGGCPGGMYIQGKTTGGVLDDQMLARGYAVASSSLNVFGNNCDDLLASETMMMVRERFIERFGPISRTIGWGCSGGSYQAEQIADNYPGLLDGVVVGCSFPDVGYAAVSVHSFGARLVYNYYRHGATTPWTEAQIVAVSGLPDFVSLRTQGDRGDRIDPAGVCSPAIPKALLYDAKTNPTGARCSIYDHGRNAYGRDPATGFARRPLDNIGVQYGLVAFRAGVITKAQFIDLNRRIGGVDIDAKFTEARTAGDPEAIRRAYRSGRILSGGGGLAGVPIIDYRAYADFAKGDPHQRFHSFSFRERLVAANGDADNQVMLTESARRGLFSLESPVLQGALDGMTAWIQAIQADRSARPAAQKVASARPAGLVDACFTEDGAKIVERQVWGKATACNRLYPPHSNPYIQAGAPLANNVLKCALKPLDPADYPAAFTPEEWAEMRRTFPTGVCDYTRPGVEQQPLAGNWLSFGPAGAPNMWVVD
ncbi:MAG: hypothetical protein EPO51_12755 [Phenylobacterium sp.]|uniref:DUF6351 family protein n=1 Tax=Phenylobacterium sp. TaxID=1871053 RepID=UPI001213E54B|nr:DUF6351 family protein [Phenylobacterium sp.]TAJ71979.1 MAG: hypothetical protein EPO51_12755 [Phenylobacterium sp.]